VATGDTDLYLSLLFTHPTIYFNKIFVDVVKLFPLRLIYGINEYGNYLLLG
jgi:hypothetical protein